ncbi:hypothetical protein NLJ89_g5178 [Agrocybe chaxingu]|uniref:F-box domain-containing protein n=1 Tax=Agrocybe chaxingu TaxID=84603 RepID=A0A9W8K1I0_9AGAR|nr:hypothetical protein NLJ89_g5178 [Agrocybe chaxingu]
MPPKLKVLENNARIEQRFKSEISSSLAAVLKTNPRMTPKEAMWSIEQKMLANNPYQPLENGKSPISDLPDEILTHIFSLGVRMQEEEEMDGYDDDDAWEDVSTDEDEDEDEDEEMETADSAEATSPGKAHDSDSDKDSLLDSDYDGSDEEDDELRIPFQVLVSHVCRRWREVVLEAHILWTTLQFSNRPRLEKAQMYISRRGDLPLDIYIDCTFPPDVDEEDHPDHSLYLENKARKGSGEEPISPPTNQDNEDDSNRFLSQREVSQILDLIEPEVAHWRTLDFRASTYSYIHLLLSRLHKLPPAPALESFQVYHFEDCDDYEFFSGDDKTPFLPFQGEAPNLKEAIFWGVHIDWESSLRAFLRDLRELELSYHAKDVRPSYPVFRQIIQNSPHLQTLTLSLSGPMLADGVAFDDEEAWGPEPLTISSVKDLALQFHTPSYASALVQHLDLPGVQNLVLNFDQEDYSEFVCILLKPVKGRTEGLLQHVEQLKISGLPCNVASVEGLLGQLKALKSFNLKVVGQEEHVIFQKLMDTGAGRPSNATSESDSGRFGELPKLFCPLLESITTTEVPGEEIKRLVAARRTLGVPLKKVLMSETDHISKKDEKWIRAHVDELDFFEPSDSEDEELELEVLDDEDEDSGDEDGDDDGGEEPFPSPFAQHLGRGRRSGGPDLD